MWVCVKVKKYITYKNVQKYWKIWTDEKHLSNDSTLYHLYPSKTTIENEYKMNDVDHVVNVDALPRHTYIHTRQWLPPDDDGAIPWYDTGITAR